MVSGTGGPQRDLRVLVVEDTEAIADLIQRALAPERFDVEIVGDLAAARARLAADPPDVMVLDVELPDGSGLQLLRELGEQGDRSSPPIVILSARGSEIDRVVGLELGAADYVVKPFFPRELATRVRRAAGTTAPEKPSRLQMGDLTIDLLTRDVSVSGEPVELTPREFDLLAHLASSPRQVFHRDDLLRSVWHSSPEWQSPKTVTEHVRRLRQKLGDDPARPRRVVTVGRAGYRFEP